jgi:molybdopterin synthase sulfur carrier subunit
MEKTQVKIKFPTQFGQYISNIDTLEFEGNKINDFVNTLEEIYGDIRERMFESDGRVRPYINIFVGSKNIESVAGLDTKLNSGDCISLLLSRAGG